MLEKMPTTAIIIGNVILLLLILFSLIYFYGDQVGIKFLNTQTETSINAEEEAGRIFRTCLQNDKQACYKEELVLLTSKTGLKEGEQTLNALQELDADARNCHVLAHYMAREEYTRNRKNWEGVLRELNVNACGSGFLHGVLEGYVGDNPGIEVDGKLADQICNFPDDPYRTRMCYHFMGHVFLVESYGDVQQALPLCDEAKGQFQFDCYNGLFMEDHQKLALAEHEISPLPTLTPDYLADLQKNCGKYTGLKGQACWTEIAEMFAHYSWYDPQAIYDGCSAAPTEAEKRSCYFKGVIVTSIYTGFDTKEKLLSICKFYENSQNDYRACIGNMFAGFTYYSPKYTDRAITLCSSLQVSDKPWCFQELGDRLKQIVAAREEREMYCQNALAEYKSMCINGRGGS